MSVSLPQSTDLLSAPSHSKLHRIVACDLTAPEQSLTVQSTGLVTATRTSAVTVDGDAAFRAYYERAFSGSNIAFGATCYLKNSGSNAPSGIAHLGGLLGWFEDSVGSQFNSIGVEARVDAHSGVSGVVYESFDANFIWRDTNSGNTTTFQGTHRGLTVQRYAYNYDGTTPRAQGTSYGIYVGNAVGFQYNYGLLIAAQSGAGTVNVSARIDAGSTYTLQLCGSTDPTTAAGGIIFGSSADTKLYRSAAGILTTDGSFVAAVSIYTPLVVTDTSTGTKIGTATNQKFGFFNATPVVQQTDGAALTNNVTSGGTDNTIADYSSLTVYATDAAAIRNNIYQLARKVKIIGDALRAYGLLS